MCNLHPWCQKWTTHIHNVTFNQHQILLDQQWDLFNAIFKHKILFDGSLGIHLHKNVHIDLKPGAKPVYHCAYPVPHVRHQAFKKEFDHIVELGILELYRACEWASPIVIIQKMVVRFDKVMLSQQSNHTSSKIC